MVESLFSPDELSEFVRLRNQAITVAVMQNDFYPMRRFLIACGEDIPEDKAVFVLGVYKAAVEIEGLPEEVKETAKAKCRAIGFSPFFTEPEAGGEAEE